MALYAVDGSIHVTVVDGTTITGLYAADGSWNVVQDDASGAMHPCGALNVTVATGTDPVHRINVDGRLNVVETPYSPTGAQRVTVVSGAFV